MNPRRAARLAPLAGLSVLVALIGACGSDDDESADVAAEDTPAEDADGGDGAEDADGADAETGDLTIETANGPVTLDEPAERVVALEWVYVEDLLAMGVEPVGVADVEGYREWVDVPVSLSDDVEDVGTRQEPSLERIMALEPDLIVTDVSRSATNYDDLDAIAPTVSLEALPMEGQWDAMEQIVTDLGELTGRSDQATEVLDNLDAAVEEARDAVADADLPSSRFLVALPGQDASQQGFRMSTTNALVSEALQALELENAWEAPPAEFGFTESDVEGLTEVDEDVLFLYSTLPEDDIVANDLPGNPVWDGLPFVEADHVYDLGAGVWLYGGPLSVETLYDRVLDALAG